ncbi:MAG TPA: RNA polymerase sigma factor [Candidatus Glassbacteria bacterium]|nr:RNA polymerase sigma factor [Candidatus Glassbacteria bacterium]
MKNAKVEVSAIDQDKELAIIIKTGSESEKQAAFAKLFAKFKPGVLQKMAIGTRFNTEVAKDLMMDVFTKIHLGFDSYNPNDGALSTWIYTIANNRLIDYKRAEKYEVLSIEDLNVKGGEDRDDASFSFQIADTSNTGNGFITLVKQERADMVLNAINAIKSEKVREVIKLRYLQDLDYDKIAELTGLPKGSIKAYVSRGREEIQHFITRKTPDFSFS